jgi:hypothetical protein
MITVLSPCWWSILLTTTWHVWYTDEHVETLLAKHTILLPGRRPQINFCVSVLHLKNIHTIVSSLQNLLGIPSLQQLAFSLYHGGFVSWRVQAQEPLGQSKGSTVSKSHENEKSRKSAARTCKWRERQSKSKERRSEIWQTDLTRHAEGCACLSEERHQVRSADRSDGACRGACMSVREATKRNTAD